MWAFIIIVITIRTRTQVWGSDTSFGGQRLWPSYCWFPKSGPSGLHQVLDREECVWVRSQSTQGAVSSVSLPTTSPTIWSFFTLGKYWSSHSSNSSRCQQSTHLARCILWEEGDAEESLGSPSDPSFSPVSWSISGKYLAGALEKMVNIWQVNGKSHINTSKLLKELFLLTF